MAINPEVGIDTSAYADFGSFFGPAWQRYTDLQRQSGINDPTKAAQDLQSYGNTFNQLFQSLVGRAPNDTEKQSFFQNVVAPQGSFPGGGYAGQQELQDRTKSFISDNFQRQAEEQALAELQGQQTEANRLADLFRTQGNTSINEYEKSILDFMNSLIERTRPQLYARMQSMGLLNTGALNEAIAGHQSDLMRDAASTVADLRLQNSQQANDIAFGGASAPYLMQQALAQNRIGNLQNMGQSAIQRAFQTRLYEQNYYNQLGLLAAQTNAKKDMLPSLGRQFGSSFLTSLGNSLGSNIGKLPFSDDSKTQLGQKLAFLA